MRVNWTEQEVERFKEAATKLGLRSNIALAKAVGTRNAKKIASFKSRFLRNNPAWAHLIDQPTPTTPPSCSSVSTGASTPPLPSTPNRQHLDSVAASDEPSQGSPVSPPVGHMSTPSPSLSDLIRRKDDSGEQPASAAVEMANRALRNLRRPLGEVDSQPLSTPFLHPVARATSNITPTSG